MLIPGVGSDLHKEIRNIKRNQNFGQNLPFNESFIKNVSLSGILVNETLLFCGIIFTV